MTNIEMIKKINSLEKRLEELQDLVSSHEEKVIMAEGIFEKAKGLVPAKYKVFLDMILGYEK